MEHGEHSLTAFDDLPATLAALEKKHLYRRRRVVESPAGRELVVDGQRLLNFCSNDYLGLAADPRVCAAFKAGVDRWGVGSGASHLVSGHTAAHQELETALADFTRRPRALLFGSGYAANVGTLSALLGQRDQVFEDRLNHASLLDGGWLSRAGFSWFAHGDSADLATQLDAQSASARRKLIVSDGTFSMDGDLCPLDRLIALAKQHAAWLMIDDAHGFGVHGAQGCGVVDPARHDCDDVPVLVGTLGKAFGTAGAFVAGSETLIETLIQRSRHYIYTTAMPAALAVATLESLRIARAEEWRRTRLAEHVAQFRQGAAQLGLQLLPSSTPIQPVIIGASAPTMQISAALQARGVLVGAIRPPTVATGSARLRITFSALHESADIERLLAVLAEAVAA